MKKHNCTKCHVYRGQIKSLANDIKEIREQNPETIETLVIHVRGLMSKLSGVVAENTSYKTKLSLVENKIKRIEGVQSAGAGNLYL